jgi:DUF4097 and DUF4098 domain-containing protein YvlB
MRNGIIIFALLLSIAFTQTKAQSLPVVFRKDTVFENISTIKVSGYYCKINVKKAYNNKLRTKVRLRAQSPEGYGLKSTITNKALELRVVQPQKGQTAHAGELTIYIPDSVNLDIQTTSGSCTVFDIAPKKLNISTKSGKVNINICTTNLLLATISGDIFLDEVNGSVNVKTRTGDIQILRINGNVITHTNLGSTRIETIQGNVNTESTSGKQHLAHITGNILANSVTGAIKISDTEGTIRILGSKGNIQLFGTTGILDIKTSKGNQTGTKICLTGNSKFTSTEGKIKMRFCEPKKGITFQLVSQKGYLFALGKSKKKKLTIGKGDILVEATSTTGTQTFF